MEKWRERRERRRIESHAELLAKTAQLEMQLDVGSWQDTISQMYALLGQIKDSRQAQRSAEDQLLDQLRLRVQRLEAVIHRREVEYDRLQERFCALQEQRAQSD